jgi:uncharacterized protein involved in exopolysaccharide biosynthesis
MAKGELTTAEILERIEAQEKQIKIYQAGMQAIMDVEKDAKRMQHYQNRILDCRKEISYWTNKL